VWLPSFLDLWVGARYDAGTLATVLICVMVLQLALVRVDSNVIDVTLRVRAKVLLGLFSVAVSAGLAVALVGPAGLGIPGLVAGFIIGRLPLTVAYPWLIGRLLRLQVARQLAAIWRPLATSVAMLAAAIWLRGHVHAGGWFSLIGLGLVTTALTLVLAAVAGLDDRQRRRVRIRLLRVVGRA
jgi:O-antigen/teichoic acid export membrane protein